MNAHAIAAMSPATPPTLIAATTSAPFVMGTGASRRAS